MRIPDNVGLVQDPIHLGVVILDKLIGDIKSKLPFLNKKKGKDDDFDDEEEDLDSDTETEVSAGDDATEEKTNVVRPRPKAAAAVEESDEEEETDLEEEEEELPADNSIVGKIKSKIASFQKKKTADEVSDEDDTGEVKPKKKKPNVIVLVVGLALIGFVLFSDFGEEENQTPAQNPAAMLKKKGKKVKPPQPTETTPTEAAPTDATPTETATTTPTETTPSEATPAETVTTTPAETMPSETVTTSPEETTPADTTVTTPTETPSETVTTTPGETTPTETISTTPTETTSTETTSSETETTTPSESSTTESTPAETVTTTPSESSSTDSVTGEETKPEDNLTEQILQDLENQAKTTKNEPRPAKTEYVAPPNYENVGRGLVYNCTGKHWACIDGPSYRTCEDNSSSTKFQKKKSECYPFNVYESQGGCEKMQNRMVSSSAKTEFCAEN